MLVDHGFETTAEETQREEATDGYGKVVEFQIVKTVAYTGQPVTRVTIFSGSDIAHADPVSDVEIQSDVSEGVIYACT